MTTAPQDVSDTRLLSVLLSGAHQFGIREENPDYHYKHDEVDREFFLGFYEEALHRINCDAHFENVFDALFNGEGSDDSTYYKFFESLSDNGRSDNHSIRPDARPDGSQ